MPSSHHSSEEPQKDMLIKSKYTPSLKGVLYNEQVRIKKITTALYVVTEHLDDLENIKRHVRQYATDLLKVSHVPYNANQEELEFRMSFILSYIDALMSFIEVAYAGQCISEANAHLLLRELRSLSIHMHHRYQDVTNQGTHKNEPYNDIDIRGIFDDINKAQATPTQPKSDTRQKEKNKEIVERGKGESKKSSPSAPLSSREERKEHIIAVITQKHTASIKDIAMHIAGCSEKTLQRDLKELIADGRILKEGSRRWSTYRIKE